MRGWEYYLFMLIKNIKKTLWQMSFYTKIYGLLYAAQWSYTLRFEFVI